MSEFRTQFNPPVAEPSPIGSHTEPTYGMVFDDATGRSVPGVTGEINVYERIQAANTGLSVQAILRNSVLTGDADALAARSGFLDTTEMPRTRAEWEKRKIMAEECFDALPVETRRAFDFDLFKFLDAVDAGAFNAPKEEISESEVNSDGENA